MTEDFNLSKNIIGLKGSYRWGNYISEEDVKKFIRELKKEIAKTNTENITFLEHKLICRIIDKLAGKELSGKKEDREYEKDEN